MELRWGSKSHAFLTGLGVGVLGSYVIYKAMTMSTSQWKMLSKWVMADQGWEKSEIQDEIGFHFGSVEDYCPYLQQPATVTNFAGRCALLCEKYTKALQDFTGESEESTCLDVGCSVGATTMELSKIFVHVLGVDASKERIAVAEDMKEKRVARYSSFTEGTIKESYEARIDTNLELDGARYVVGDPCQLPDYLAAVDCVLGALVLNRLHRPLQFLESLPRLLKTNGTVVLVTDYSWDPATNSQRHQLVGFVGQSGARVSSEGQLKKVMETMGFKLLYSENIPLFRRENARKFRWIVGHATVWQVDEGHRSQDG